MPRQVQVAYTGLISIVVNHLQALGIDVYSLAERCEFPLEAIDNHRVITEESWHQLINALVEDQGSQILFRISQDFLAQTFCPTVVDQLPGSFSESLNVLMGFARSMSYSDRVALAQTEHHYQLVQKKVYLDSKSTLFPEQLALSFMIEMIRMLTGTDWQPTEVFMQSDAVSDDFKALLGRRCKIYCQHSQTKIVIAKDLTVQNLVFLNHQTGFSDDSALQGEDLSTANIAVLLKPYIDYGRMPINKAAVLLGVSSRTLQRRLLAQGTSYNAFVDGLLKQRMASLVLSSGDSFTDIAQLLGYSTPGHFSRAFKKLTGMSPREYRQHGAQS
ncbi:hypothetical protein SIN8267_02605 [Sinobacterium norvegicum]|uniref:HTH araC/xylS-type domain-containing protein n=2 Tax=Sinobacterium norvegicum TaxID=1641715 RepID=A0ABM9AIA3_9GAMM|nr:hypothetical protein SIN8267_02605 [Sinobacterium norvegicum]